MTCKEIREVMPDLALGLTPASAEAGEHLRVCVECAGKLEALRSTLALLDEWHTPEPSAYFDTRLQARLREEKAKVPAGGWLAWMRMPALALAVAILVAVGITMFRGVQDETTADNRVSPAWVGPSQAPPGTAVGDLQALEKNHDLYSDFEVLDELQVQQDVNANP